MVWAGVMLEDPVGLALDDAMVPEGPEAELPELGRAEDDLDREFGPPVGEIEAVVDVTGGAGFVANPS